MRRSKLVDAESNALSDGKPERELWRQFFRCPAEASAVPNFVPYLSRYRHHSVAINYRA
jgi:hypothetical protein